jgi:hypothetical protein
MKMPQRPCSLRLTALALIFTLMTAGFPVRAADDPVWPRERDQDGARIVLYQPQIDDWKQFRQVSGRMAIALTPKGGKQHVGVVTVLMDTDTDMDSRMVLLSNPRITETSFPGEDAASAKRLDQLARSFLNPDATMTISVDRLVASVDDKGAAPGVDVKNDPPVILASFGPAILVLIDGEPVLAPVEKADMQYVINASWPLFLDNASHQYYLFTGERWVTSGEIKSGWKETAKLPLEMVKIPGDPQWPGLKPYVGPPAKNAAKAPAVFVSNVPAELIVFGGKPVYAPVPGTKLTFATNTDSDFFVYSPTGAYYYLSAGRWFSAPGPTGPWTYTSDTLPSDFANIPPNSTAGEC